MLDSYIVWNGVSSETFGLYVKKEPNFNKPRRKSQTFSVDGRNGDVVIMQDFWENTVQEYTLFLRPELLNSDIAQLSHQIANWLHSANDYAELSDSYDLDHFRLAYFVDEINIENHLNEFGTISIRFNCRPEHFLNSGKIATTYTSSPIVIRNETQYIAYPLIDVARSGTDESVINFNSFPITIWAQTPSSSQPQNFQIDCDAKTVKRGGTFLRYQADYFPDLIQGTTRITWTSSNITSITITPRWWEL